MIYDEHVHADVVIAFWRAMDGDKDLFVRCVRSYGEERGRRMAMRALRNGYPLNANAYFACGELISTRPELADSRPGSPVEGAAHTLNYNCMWCEGFRQRGAVDCAKVYCHEIDASLVRGFNADMTFELREYMHTSDHCDFVFGDYDSSVSYKKPEGAGKDFLYHCAHTYYSFEHTVLMCSRQGNAIAERARAILTGWHTKVFFEGIDRFRYLDFLSIEE